MTRIDGATTARLDARSEPLDRPLPDVFATFDAEFFVEWQVAEHPSLARARAASEK